MPDALSNANQLRLEQYKKVLSSQDHACCGTGCLAKCSNCEAIKLKRSLVKEVLHQVPDEAADFVAAINQARRDDQTERKRAELNKISNPLPEIKPMTDEEFKVEVARLEAEQKKSKNADA